MNENVSSTDFIMSIICDAGTFELLRLINSIMCIGLIVCLFVFITGLS